MELDSLGHGGQRRIAGSEPCSVYRCACGCVHVHIGAFTVRLAPETFRDLASLMGEAAAVLAQDGSAVRRH